MAAWLILTVLGLIIFWPEYGLYMRWRRNRRLNSRRAVEDALMHIHQRQHEGRPASVESLSSSLRMPPRSILGLIQRMEGQRLLIVSGDGIHLSTEGHRWALQVVRAHRLLERYLADETSVPMEELHSRAHRLEHSVSTDELNKLDADLGHPAFDPQGDPIPSAGGEEPPVIAGRSLVDWPTNTTAQIVHIEDEPDEVYAQIVAEGLEPGMVVNVIESSETRLVIETERMEVAVLAPVVAANVSVVKTSGETHARQGRRLSSLKMGEPGRVIAIDSACRGLTRRRFLDLGITPGVMIEPVMESAFRDPTAYRVRGSLIALRREQSDLIRIEPATHEPAVHYTPTI